MADVLFVDDSEIAGALDIEEGQIDDEVGRLALAACGLIRDFLGQTVHRVDAEVAEIHGTDNRVILVPQLPVIEVALLTEQIHGQDTVTTLIDGSDYVLEAGTEGRRGILRRLSGPWWRAAAYRLTYSHGYNVPTTVVPPGDPDGWDVPETLKTVALGIMRRVYDNPGATRQYSAGRFSQTVSGSVLGLGLTSSDRMALAGHLVGDGSGA